MSALWEVIAQTGPRPADLERVTLDGSTSWTRRTAIKKAEAYTAKHGRPAFAQPIAGA